MLSCSAAYNLARPSRRKQLLRRLDHAVIFVMIAATYTPVTVIALGEGSGDSLLTFVWAVAVLGACFKLMFPERLERAAVALYLLLGWSFVAAWEPIVAVVPRPALLLLALGGMLYSAGVAFFLLERLPYHTAIWHGFVLLAAACHYAAILGWLAPLPLSPA